MRLVRELLLDSLAAMQFRGSSSGLKLMFIEDNSSYIRERSRKLYLVKWGVLSGSRALVVV